MFRHRIPIGRLFGITIDLDYSWFLIVGLLTWILAVSYYPVEFRGWSKGEYWLMGLITAVMLFVSVLIHELGHSVVAKRFGLSVPRITLFLFGGVSQIAAEPPSAAVEFWIAVVGPVVSFALAALFWELEQLLAWSQPLYALAKYLALLNLILGVFNLIPGFPLDGGRVFRALVWRITGKYQRATAIAGVTGRFFGFFLIFIGVWEALSGNFIGGLWIAFIGWFLESAAGSQLQQEVLKHLLGEHKVIDAMKRDFPEIAGSVTLQELVDNHVLPGGNRYFIVRDSGGTAGMVTLGGIRSVPRAAWADTTAAQIMVPLEKLATTRPDAVLWSALEKMGRDGVNQLPVVQGNSVVGVLSRDDLLHYLQVLRSFAA
ncbi:MAG TPA: site-2 protease family protein [Verrucomicrobiae bacterium]|nr:site-2 protease family protein [Verrucomicrobiae bacterium]